MLGSVAPVQQEKVSEEPLATCPLKIRAWSLSEGNWTGEGLGSLLHCYSACTWTHLSLQQNTKKLYGTKNKCMHRGLEQILDKRYRETKKPNCHFWRAWNRNRVLGTKAGYWACPPELNTTRGVGKPPKPSAQPEPWTHSYLHPM